MDTVQPNARVTLEYTLRDDEGHVLDSSDADDGEPIVYVHGYGMVVPGLEAALAGMRAGESKDVVVPPDEAFGEHDDELVLEVARTDLPRPDKVEPGDELVAESPDGDEIAMRVIEVKDQSVLLDANHPLAGMTLHYGVTVREVCAASDEEIEEAAEAFDEAGYDDCDDPTHDHDHDHDHGSLVQLRPSKSKQN